ncbi:hypothetical protein K470DRAFT_268431 [Piedraia hortae CBS 480.64]|uniref:Uncharacterized protein n=1 Tax=Piedraia hortae CBS 480.64 TaxID=1314780 RepID=A0A6A7C853_9PEZI|nr:hypothetical protein K470DRAFT_268431 [Piedraia hortae CBS 480.64]
MHDIHLSVVLQLLRSSIANLTASPAEENGAGPSSGAENVKNKRKGRPVMKNGGKLPKYMYWFANEPIPRSPSPEDGEARPKEAKPEEAKPVAGGEQEKKRKKKKRRKKQEPIILCTLQ